MSIYKSTRNYADFFKQPSRRNYAKLRNLPESKDVYDFLQTRIDWLIASITNHKKPALQGVILDLEHFLNSYPWRVSPKDCFFITMVGAMVCYLVEEFGFVPEKSGVKLRHSNLITTGATYKVRVP